MTHCAVNASTLRVEVQKRNVLRERLLAELPDLDETTLVDTLDGITNTKEQIAEIIRSSLDDESLTGGLERRLQDMKERRDRLDHRARIKRDIASSAMKDAEIAKLVEPDFTASLRQGVPTLDIVSEASIPAPYWKPQPPKLDRLGLLHALKAGTAVNGAVLAPAKLQISVRTK